MKLRNKKTGEIRNVEIMGDNFLIEAKDYPNDTTIVIKSLAELNEEWEDYEEPETFWGITAWGDVYDYSQSQLAIKQKQTIGNYFETKEEAEKAVEKLKALKRLRDNNLRLRRGCITFVNTDEVFTTMDVNVKVDTYANVEADLDLLFSGGGE